LSEGRTGETGDAFHAAAGHSRAQTDGPAPNVDRAAFRSIVASAVIALASGNLLTRMTPAKTAEGKEPHMFKQMILASAIALGIVAIGCEKEESTKTSTPSAPAAPSTPSTPSASATTAPSAGAMPSMGDMKSAASSATQQAGAAISTAAPSDVPAASATTAPASGAAAAADTQAQKLIDQAMQYVKDNKYDLAEKALTQADGMKSSLSPTLQSALEKAHSAVNAAKAAGGTGIKLPGQ
jgi:hypothetical protein